MDLWLMFSVMLGFVTLLIIQQAIIWRQRKSLREFIIMMSHELRTTMAVIREGIDLVLSGATGNINEKQKHFLTLAERNVDRFTALINKILRLQSTKQGRKPHEN